MNLSINAIQAMSQGGLLSVDCQRSTQHLNEFICFSIRDSGIGIEKENIDKIFDPFYTTKENGTGLGLAIVKRFIEYHAGHICIKSQYNLGTTVYIYLPSYKSSENFDSGKNTGNGR